MPWALLLLSLRRVSLRQCCFCVQTSSLLFNCLGAFPGTIHGFGLMLFTFKLLPNDKKLPTTGTYHQLESKEKAKGSLRPLAEAKVDWAYAIFLPTSSEEATMVFLFFLAGLSPRSTFYAAFLSAGGGGAKKVMKALSKFLDQQGSRLWLSAASMQSDSIALQWLLLK
jgi:hypothetical protein